MSKVFVVLLMITASFLVGCGGSDGDSSNQVNNSVDYGLNGTWDMYEDDLYVGEAIVNGLDYTMIASEGDFVISAHGTATQDGTKLTQPNDVVVTMTTLYIKDASMKITSQAAVSGANSILLCGYSDWSLNIVKDISDAADCLDSSFFDPMKDIYALESNKIIWGDFQSLDSNGYPEGLSLHNYWIKK